MARGWESKSVEEQIDLAESRKASSAKRKLSDAQAQLEREREGIELSRGRIIRELEAARHPRHREQLSQALNFLDEQLAKLQSEPQQP